MDYYVQMDKEPAADDESIEDMNERLRKEQHDRAVELRERSDKKINDQSILNR